MRLCVFLLFCIAFLPGCQGFLDGLISSGSVPDNPGFNSPGADLGEAIGQAVMSSPYGTLFGIILGAFGLKGKQKIQQVRLARREGS